MSLYIAADKSGDVYLYLNYPKQDEEEYITEGPSMCIGNGKDSGFDISFENGPIEVDIIIKDKLNFKLADETKRIIERETGKNIEKIHNTSLKRLLKDIQCYDY